VQSVDFSVVVKVVFGKWNVWGSRLMSVFRAELRILD